VLVRVRSVNPRSCSGQRLVVTQLGNRGGVRLARRMKASASFSLSKGVARSGAIRQWIEARLEASAQGTVMAQDAMSNEERELDLSSRISGEGNRISLATINKLIDGSWRAGDAEPGL
jgi:hypothetical protein